MIRLIIAVNIINNMKTAAIVEMPFREYLKVLICIISHVTTWYVSPTPLDVKTFTVYVSSETTDKSPKESKLMVIRSP